MQNFVSAATGMAVLVALIRGLARRTAETIGNFWVDLVRSTVYILLPLSIVVGAGAGVAGRDAELQAVRDGRRWCSRSTAPTASRSPKQTLPMGPAASQIAIKQLGTNGGGFFNVNSAHPFENPTPLSNFLEMLAILLISGGAVLHVRRDGRRHAARLGRAGGDVRHLRAAHDRCRAGRAGGRAGLQRDGRRSASVAPRNRAATWKAKKLASASPIPALWATATTAASNGSVNSMHDSFTPLGGLVPMWLMQLGEVVFGGVGSGLYGMLMFAIVAVFVAGLMVGRTPEYLGKKIEAFEMKMASLVILIPPLVVLVGTAIAVVGPGLDYAVRRRTKSKATSTIPGAHGFSEVLYAFSSAGNNNGSAFAGLTANEPFYNTALGTGDAGRRAIG